MSLPRTKPDAHCRLHRYRSKNRNRYRSPAAFDLTTTALYRAVEAGKAVARQGRAG